MKRNPTAHDVRAILVGARYALRNPQMAYERLTANKTPITDPVELPAGMTGRAIEVSRKDIVFLEYETTPPMFGWASARNLTAAAPERASKEVSK